VDLVEAGLEHRPPLGRDAVGRLDGHLAQLHQMLEVAIAHGLAAPDLLVEQGLGERGLVALVVSAAAVAEHVDDHVALELAAVVEGQGHRLGHGLGVLAVDVEDRDLQHLRHVGAVAGRAGVMGQGREPDLVVDHHVQRAAGAVAAQLGEVQRLLDDALADEGRVAVDQDRHAAGVVVVLQAVLLGADPADRHRVDVLQVAGVEAEGQVHGVAVAAGPVAVEALVVLDVAVAEVEVRLAVLELGEDLARALAHDVGQDVQAAAVGHAQDDVLDALAAGVLDRLGEQRDQALGALEREALGAGVLLLDELLEQDGVGQAGQDVDLVVRAAARCGSRSPPCAGRASAGTRCRRCA
jgi:hypothetical protein